MMSESSIAIDHLAFQLESIEVTSVSIDQSQAGKFLFSMTGAIVTGPVPPAVVADPPAEADKKSLLSLAISLAC